MVMGGGPMMMLARWMLSHGIFLPNRFLKWMPVVTYH